MAIDLTKLEKKFIDLFANVTQEEFEQWLLSKTKSKPMAQQKLYTEEQVIRAIELSDNSSTDEVLAGLTPIELPSDEGAGVIALKIVDALEDKLTSSQEAFVIAGFTTYNKWLKAQILNQTK